MAIVIASDLKNIDPWINALKKEDPAIEVIPIDGVTNKKDVQFVLAWNYPSGLFSEYPELKTISSMGAGVDHLLKDNLLPDSVNIVRINDPLLSHDMYEFSLAVIMNRLRQLTFYNDNQRSGIWKKKAYMRISDVRIGIMGTGVIGNHIATELDKTGFNVSGWSRTRGQNYSYKKYSGSGQMEAFLRTSDILICLLPLTPETAGILNARNLQMLPERAWIVNLGRGGHLVDKDLIELLDTGRLDGANLDVFREEPLPPDHPFWRHPKIYMTPHIASLPLPESVAPQIIDNYYRTIRNRSLLNTVNRDRGY